MDWVNRYIGIPYANRGRGKSLDCWGLIRRIYTVQRGINLDNLDGYSDSEDDRQVMGVIDKESESNWEMVRTPALYDVIVFKLAGKPCHVGLALGDNTFIHALKGRDVSVERLSNVLWRNRVFEIFEYVGGRS